MLGKIVEEINAALAAPAPVTPPVVAAAAAP